MLDSQLEKWKNEKEALSQSHDQQVGTLQATVNQLKSSLDKERQSSTDVKVIWPHIFFQISHFLSIVELWPSSSLSTGCVVSLRGD